MEDTTAFCNSCGAELSGVKEERTREVQNKLPSFSTLSLKTKIILGSILAILIIGFSLYKVGESYTDKTKVLENFEEHLKKGNVSELVHLLDSDDESVKIKKKNVEALLKYLKENPDEKEYLLSQLHENSNQDGIVLAASSDDSNQIITFEKKGKRFFLYDNYDFVLHSFPLVVNTNYDELRFFLNGKEVASPVKDGDQVTLGSFLPGTYKVKAVLTSDFVELEKEIEVSHFGETESDLSLDVDYVYVNSNVDGASILINGKDTGVKVNKEEAVEVGPVLIDGSMTLQVEKELPFGKAQSPSVSIEQNDISANLILNDEQKEAVTNEIKQYLLNYSKAIAYQDKKYLKENNLIVSDFVSSSFEELFNGDLNYFGYLVNLKLDLESVYLEEIEGEWTVGVSVLEEWMEDYVYSGDSISLSEEEYARTYRLTYDSKTAKKWIVDSWDSSWSFDDSKAKKVEIDAAAQKKQLESSPKFNSIYKEELNSDVSTFVESYITSSVQAFNYRDFSIISNEIDPSSDYTKTVSDYIDHLEEKGITEDLVNINIEKVEQQNDVTFHVYTLEEYHIYYNDNTAKYKAFEGKYEVRSTTEGLKMYKLLSTDEVDSQDL